MARTPFALCIISFSTFVSQVSLATVLAPSSPDVLSSKSSRTTLIRRACSDAKWPSAPQKSLKSIVTYSFCCSLAFPSTVLIWSGISGDPAKDNSAQFKGGQHKERGRVNRANWTEVSFYVVPLPTSSCSPYIWYRHATNSRIQQGYENNEAS